MALARHDIFEKDRERMVQSAPVKVVADLRHASPTEAALGDNAWLMGSSLRWRLMMIPVLVGFAAPQTSFPRLAAHMLRGESRRIQRRWPITWRPSTRRPRSDFDARRR
jgi:hypothetical protein